MISIVFPFYNESTRIHLLKNGLDNYQNRNSLIKELVLVDDGSTDDTLVHLQNIQHHYSQYQIKIVQVSPNKGKGNAIRQGVLAATQPWMLCNDSDLSYSMEQIDEWVENFPVDFTKKNTVYFGSRELGKKNNEMQLFIHRVVIGRVYAFLIRCITGITVKDTQCGFKLYPATVAKKIFPLVQEQRFAFDVEVHYLLKKQKIATVLLPVKCIDVDGSKVHLIKDSIKMFQSLFRIVKRHQG